MATLYIREYGGISSIGTMPAPIPPEPGIADQTLALSGTSNPSAAFNALTHAVLLTTDADCSVVFGSAPVAAATNFRLFAKGPALFVSVRPGDKVAAIV